MGFLQHKRIGGNVTGYKCNMTENWECNSLCKERKGLRNMTGNITGYECNMTGNWECNWLCKGEGGI